MIDKNNPDYTTPIQEEIWNIATDRMPLEVTLPMIPEEYHSSCTDLYNFFTDLLNDMYQNPDPYLEISEVQTYVRWFWMWMWKKFQFEDSGFSASRDEYKKFAKKMGAPLMDFMLSHYGFKVDYTEDSVHITNTRYPGMLTAVNDTLTAAYQNYNVNCTDFLPFCDFRAIVNYKRTYHDMFLLLNRDGAAIADMIYEYALEHGIKPAKCTYFNRVEFKKKGKIVFILDVAAKKDLKLNIGFANIGGEAFHLLEHAIEELENRDELLTFWRRYIKKCIACAPVCPKRSNPVIVFGKKMIICDPFIRMYHPNESDLKYIFKLIDLRTMAVDAGLSEPFYPGNG